MDSLFYIFAVVVALAATLAAIAIRARLAPALKSAALGIAALLIASGYIGFVELLGKPKPVDLEWFRAGAKSARVIAARLNEGKAIYLWLEIDGDDLPRAYVLPWSLKRALELQKAMRQAKARGTGVRMRRPFGRSKNKKKPVFHAIPQVARPPKRVGAALR